ncbi:hypothetical protein HK101_011602, partial [Irineochytrium annulatum]
MIPTTPDVPGLDDVSSPDEPVVKQAVAEFLPPPPPVLPATPPPSPLHSLISTLPLKPHLLLPIRASNLHQSARALCALAARDPRLLQRALIHSLDAAADIAVRDASTKLRSWGARVLDDGIGAGAGVVGELVRSGRGVVVMEGEVLGEMVESIVGGGGDDADEYGDDDEPDLTLVRALGSGVGHGWGAIGVRGNARCGEVMRAVEGLIESGGSGGS